MLELLTAAADVITVLGASQSVVDFIRDSRGKEDQRFQKFLLEMVTISRAWKQFHQEYHTIIHSMRKLEQAVRLNEARHVGDLSRHEIIAAMTDANLKTAYEDMPFRLLSSKVRILQTFEEESAVAARAKENLRTTSFLSVMEAIDKLKSARRFAMRDHERVCAFLAWGLKNYSNTDWKEHNREELVEFSPVFQLHFHNVITQSDVAIIAVLDIYEQFISKRN